MEEEYNMTHINNRLTGPYTISSTTTTSVNFTIQNIDIKTKEKKIKEDKK